MQPWTPSTTSTPPPSVFKFKKTLQEKEKEKETFCTPYVPRQSLKAKTQTTQTNQHTTISGSKRGRGRGRGRGTRGPLSTLEQQISFFAALQDEDEAEADNHNHKLPEADNHNHKLPEEEKQKQKQKSESESESESETTGASGNDFLKTRETQKISRSHADDFPLPCVFIPSSESSGKKKYKFPRWKGGQKIPKIPHVPEIPGSTFSFCSAKTNKKKTQAHASPPTLTLEKKEKGQRQTSSHDLLLFSTISKQLSSTKRITNPDQLNDFIQQHFGVLSLESRKKEEENGLEEIKCTCSSMTHRPSLCILSTLYASLGKKESVLVVTTFGIPKKKSEIVENESEIKTKTKSRGDAEEESNNSNSNDATQENGQSNAGQYQYVTFHYKTGDTDIPETLSNLFSCPLISKVWTQKEVPWRVLCFHGIESWNISFVDSTFLYSSFVARDDGADFIKFYFLKETDKGARSFRIGARVSHILSHLLGEEIEVCDKSPTLATQQHTVILFFLALSFGLCLPIWPIEESQSQSQSQSFGEAVQKQFQVIAAQNAAQNLFRRTSTSKKISLTKVEEDLDL